MQFNTEINEQFFNPSETDKMTFLTQFSINFWYYFFINYFILDMFIEFMIHWPRKKEIDRLRTENANYKESLEQREAAIKFWKSLADADDNDIIKDIDKVEELKKEIEKLQAKNKDYEIQLREMECVIFDQHKHAFIRKEKYGIAKQA